jgi:DNA-binding protein H-NS
MIRCDVIFQLSHLRKDIAMAGFKDYVAELKVLQQKQRELRAKHAQQLGDLVVATGADTLDPATLAGALLAAVKSDKASRASWQAEGGRFLEGRTRTRRKAASGGTGPETHASKPGTPEAEPGAQ